MAIESFAAAREAHLRELDRLQTQLRRIVSDAEWCNVEYPTFKGTVDDIACTCQAISRLNDAQIAAERASA